MRLEWLGLRVLGLVLSGLVAAVACGSPSFTASETGGTGGGAEAGDGGTSATGGSTTGGSGGTTTAGGGGTQGGTMLCTESADCDDQNPCTIDSCAGNGVCVREPKCTGAQPLCCDGVCGECCKQEDCNDSIACTDDVCFAGFCTNTPNTSCGEGRYCGPTGCMDREECGEDSPCDDQNPCTTDTCIDGFCSYENCPEGGSCCPGMGCGLCCIDAQCASADEDPCTVNVCEEGRCAVRPLCDDGEMCCRSREGDTATCGSCCSAADCPDPGVECLTAVCAGSCTTQVVPNVCAEDETCDPTGGCIGGSACVEPSDCQPPSDPCDTVTCNQNGECQYGEVQCSNGTKCCANVADMSGSGHCRQCCGNQDCATGTLCCPADGACRECCADTDCGVAVADRTFNDDIIPGTCSVPACIQGTCSTKSICGVNEQCCNGFCQPFGSPCINPEI
jgi:hypothetical protein